MRWRLLAALLCSACFVDSGNEPGEDSGSSGGSESSSGGSESTATPPGNYPPPQLYWSFDDAVSGTLFADAGDIAGVVHGATPVPGHVGDAFAFEGADQFVDFGQVAATFEPTAVQYTIALWVRVEPGDSGALVTEAMAPDWGCSPNLNGANLVTGITQLGFPSFRMYQLRGTWFCSTDATIDIRDGEWHHLAFIYDGSVEDILERYTIAVDGRVPALDRSGSSGCGQVDVAVDNPAPLNLGGMTDNTEDLCESAPFGFLRGHVDELAVWPSVLSGSDLEAVHARGADGLPL